MNWEQIIPDWVQGAETLIDWYDHPTAEAWVEIHENPETGEIIYLAIDTSGCNGGLIGDGVYDDFDDACDAVGAEYGFSELWTAAA